MLIMKKLNVKKILERENLFIIIIKLLIVIFIMGLIFYLSSDNGSLSSIKSDYIVNNIITLTNINFNVDYLTFIVRKFAHFFIYFLLGISVINLFDELNIKRVILYSLIFCIVYSISDEVHQLFVFDRTFKVLDILIDSFGSFTGIISYYIGVNYGSKDKRFN